jgi:hypothetical protein
MFDRNLLWLLAAVLCAGTDWALLSLYVIGWRP